MLAVFRKLNCLHDIDRQFLVNYPASRESGNCNDGDDPKPNRRVHTVDADQRDKDRAACAPKNVGDQETACGDGAETRHVAHQVAGENG